MIEKTEQKTLQEAIHIQLYVRIIDDELQFYFLFLFHFSSIFYF